jgi:hypothetical protein
MDNHLETDDIGVTLQRTNGYWETRKHLLYYKAVFQYVSVIGYNAQSIIDVGSASSKYLEWMNWIPNRSVLDFKIPKKNPDINAIEVDFFNFFPSEKFDVTLCCQVLEHVTDPERFCTKLKEISKRLLITVPYKWLGNAPGHIHDPVTEEKLFSWMHIKPNSSQIIHEPFREGRLIAYYDLENGANFRFEKEFIFVAIAEKSKFSP